MPKRRFTRNQVIAILGSQGQIKPGPRKGFSTVLSIRDCAKLLKCSSTSVQMIRAGYLYKEIYQAFHKGS